jgi:hypothetical protein
VPIAPPGLGLLVASPALGVLIDPPVLGLPIAPPAPGVAAPVPGAPGLAVDPASEPEPLLVAPGELDDCA